MANAGELDVENLGGETRTLTFKTAQMLILGKRLEADPLSFIAGGGSQEVFLVESIFAGLSRSDTAKKLNPVRIAGWLDVWDGDRAKLCEEILYAIARGKPGKEGAEMAKALDDAFGRGQTPTNAG